MSKSRSVFGGVILGLALVIPVFLLISMVVGREQILQSRIYLVAALAIIVGIAYMRYRMLRNRKLAV